MERSKLLRHYLCHCVAWDLQEWVRLSEAFALLRAREICISINEIVKLFYSLINWLWLRIDWLITRLLTLHADLDLLYIHIFFSCRYQIDLTTKTNTGNSLPLAKPEFTYKIVEEKYSLPKIRIYWFPCGKSEECKNTRPGSSFQVKYK